MDKHRIPSVFMLLTALAGVHLQAQQTGSSKPSAAAASDGAIELFPAVIVSATGYGKQPFAMPFSTAVLTSRWLDERLPRTMPGALSELPGIMVQKTGYAQGSPYIRGFTGFRTLLLVDGIRLNNSVFREGPNQYWGTVDPFSIERLEVIKGSSSVSYGSDAIGGTVNAVTAGRPVTGAECAVSTRTLYRFASAEDSHTGRFATDARFHDRWSGHVGLSVKRYGDLRAGKGTGVQLQTGYREYALNGKLNYSLTEELTASALFQSVTQEDAWRTHTTIHGSDWRGTRPGGDRQRSLDQRRTLFAVQIRGALPDGPVDRIHASISTHIQEEDQLRIRGDRRRDDSGFEAKTGGAFVQLQSPSRMGRWVYGGELYRDWVDSYSIRYRADGSLMQVDLQGPVAGKAIYDLAGAYLENRLPALGAIDLIVGGRYNHAAADAKRIREPVTDSAATVMGDWHALVASMRGVFRLGAANRMNVIAGVSQAFRAPNLSDLTRFDIAEGGQIETPAPDLDAETFITAEIGLRTRQSLWSAEAAYFHTAIENQIIRTPTGRRVDGLEEVTKRNSGSGFVHGFEVAGSVQMHVAWTLWANFTWLEGELDYFPTSSSSLELRAPMSRAMPATCHAGLRWEPPSAGYWVEVAGSAAARQDRLAPNDRVDIERIPPDGTPGYVVANLRAGWRPAERLQFTAAIENITNRDFRIHGSGLNEPGRNLVLTAEFRF